jgi:hypothetical protein
MQGSSTTASTGKSGNHSKTQIKQKKPYFRPKARMVTPDQAEAEVRAKAAQGSRDFKNCVELIAEARKNQGQ